MADTAKRTLAFIAFMAAAACLTGCGAAGRVSTGAACGAIMVAIGEAEHLEPARAHADLESQSAICSRLAPDAGVSP